MQRLRDILYKVNIRSVNGSTDLEISDVQIDSRKIKPGSLFIAVKGVAFDGHQFIDKAIEAGAAGVVFDEALPVKKEGAVYVQVENSAAAAGLIAHNFLRFMALMDNREKPQFAKALRNRFICIPGKIIYGQSKVKLKIPQPFFKEVHSMLERWAANSDPPLSVA